MSIITQMMKTQWMLDAETLHRMHAIAARDNAALLKMIETNGSKEYKNSYAMTLRGDIAVIPVRGVIFRHASLLNQICGATTLEFIARDFQAALDNDSIKAIVFDIDSGGGDSAGINEFSEIIYQSRGKKPIKAYVESTCCSAAYFIASACDEIVVDELAAVGSVGTVAVIRKADESAIEIVSSQSPNKRVDCKTEEGQSKIRTMLDDITDVFLTKVARNRNMTKDQVVEAGDRGGVIVGRKAVLSGLVSRLGSYEGLIKELQSGEINQKTEVNIMNDKNDKHVETPEHHTELTAEQERERVLALLEMSTPETADLITEAIKSGASVADSALEAVNLLKARQTTTTQSQKEPALCVPPIPEKGLATREEEETQMLLNALNSARR